MFHVFIKLNVFLWIHVQFVHVYINRLCLPFFAYDEKCVWYFLLELDIPVEKKTGGDLQQPFVKPSRWPTKKKGKLKDA